MSTRHFRTSDGLNLGYRDEGAGPPVLCLAGLTRNMTDFETVVRDFSDRARIIRLDYRGRGESDHDPDYMNYSILRESQDALEFLDHLGLAKAAILGTSRGGLIAMTIATLAKDRLTGVCLNDIGPVIEPDGLTFIMGFLGKRPDYTDYESAADGLMEARSDRFPGVPRETWRTLVERLWIERPDGLHLRYDPRLRDAVIEQSASGAVVDLWPMFDALAGLPVALLRGANSDLLSVETAAEMKLRRPDMLYAEVADRGHVPFLDEPEAIAVISDFLDRLP